MTSRYLVRHRAGSNLIVFCYSKPKKKTKKTAKKVTSACQASILVLTVRALARNHGGIPRDQPEGYPSGVKIVRGIQI